MFKFDETNIMCTVINHTASIYDGVHGENQSTLVDIYYIYVDGIHELQSYASSARVCFRSIDVSLHFGVRVFVNVLLRHSIQKQI